MITLNQALYYLFILETEEHEMNKLKFNDLSIAIFGEIVKPLSIEILKDELKRVIIRKKDFLKSKYEMKVDKTISGNINVTSIEKTLVFAITETEVKIAISSITEKTTKVNYLKGKIILLK